MVVEFYIHSLQFGVKPLHSNPVGLGLLHIHSLPTLYKAEGVPYLVIEVAALLTQTLIEEDVIAGRSREHHTHAHTIGTEFLDEFDGVGRITQTLRHLPAQFVAHDTGEIHVLKRELAHILLASHNHSCHPEEDDIGCSDKVAGGVVVVDLLIARIIDTVEE